jgi:hypothetical protein
MDAEEVGRRVRRHQRHRHEHAQLGWVGQESQDAELIVAAPTASDVVP